MTDTGVSVVISEVVVGLGVVDEVVIIGVGGVMVVFGLAVVVEVTFSVVVDSSVAMGTAVEVVSGLWVMGLVRKTNGIVVLRSTVLAGFGVVVVVVVLVVGCNENVKNML